MRSLLTTILCFFTTICFNQERHCGIEKILRDVGELEAKAFMEISDAPIAFPRNEIVLPIVVHVVYSDEAFNISDFQILSQLDALNQAFSNEIKLANDILADHRAVIGMPGIRFALACRDPHGNPTTGITRTKTSTPEIGFHFAPSGVYAVHHSQYGGADPWPTDRYINIWVAEMSETLLGRSSIPIDLPDPNQDGVVIASRNFGFAGLAASRQPYHLGRTLVHEIGHYFGLNHPWGSGNGTCNQDDGVDDTPNQSEIYYDCPVESTSSSCGSADMTKNFMGYTDDACLQYFTQGQVNRILNVLNGYRASLLSSDAISNCGGSMIPEELLLWNKIDTKEWIAQFPTLQSEIKFELYNIKGQKVHEATIHNKDLIRIQLDTISAGIYVAIFSFEGKIIQKKLNIL